MTSNLQDTLTSLAADAEARAGRSDDDAHRATLGAMVGAVRRRRAARHTGTAVLSAGVVTAVAVGGSQLIGGTRTVPGAVGPGGLDQAEQLALVNAMGVECGAPLPATVALDQWNPIMGELRGARNIDRMTGSRPTGFDVRVGVDPSTTTSAIAVVAVRDGGVVGFAAARPTADALVDSTDFGYDLVLHLPTLMNCDGPGAVTQDGSYQLYYLFGEDVSPGTTDIIGAMSAQEMTVSGDAPIGLTPMPEVSPHSTDAPGTEAAPRSTEGIVDDPTTPEGEGDIVGTNRWTGTVDGRAVTVYAGCSAHDATTGQVMVIAEGATSVFSSNLLDVGALRVVSSEGNVLHIADSTGAEYLFDVASLTFLP